MSDARNPREERELADRRHRALLELAALDKSDFEGVLRRILRTDAEELGIARVNCWRFESDPPALRCICAVSRERDEVEHGAVFGAHDIPLYFESLTKDPIILADDARTDPRTKDLCEGYLLPLGITSLMDVPVWVRGGLWGVICHEHVGLSRHWTKDERDFAVSIGHIVSMAVEARERDKAERTARTSEFSIGILSHDLRNPLNVVAASTEYIRARAAIDARIDESVKRAAMRIAGNVERMTRMVEQLLDFTRIRAGIGLPIVRSELDLYELCKRVVAELQDAMPGQSIALRMEGEARGQWDQDRVWQLVSNVIINAVEHGEDVHVLVDGHHAQEVVLHISNRGVLAPDLLPEIFEPFRRSDGAHAPGLGLGLFIAKEIVVAHGGTIDVETHDDEIDFTIRLPRFAPNARESNVQMTQPPSTSM